MVGRRGLEPLTHRASTYCSTNWTTCPYVGLRPLFGESWGLSYFGNRRWWAIKGSNLESSGYEPAAITSYANGP